MVWKLSQALKRNTRDRRSSTVTTHSTTDPSFMTHNTPRARKTHEKEPCWWRGTWPYPKSSREYISAEETTPSWSSGWEEINRLWRRGGSVSLRWPRSPAHVVYNSIFTSSKKKTSFNQTHHTSRACDTESRREKSPRARCRALQQSEEKGRLKKHVITLCRRLSTSKKSFPQNENYMF